MDIDFVTLSQLCLDAVLDASSKLGVVLGQRMLLVLHSYEHPVDIFPHILTSQFHVLANILCWIVYLPFTIGS